MYEIRRDEMESSCSNRWDLIYVSSFPDLCESLHSPLGVQAD